MKITGQLGVLLLAIVLCGAFVAVLCVTFWLDAACLSPQRRIVMKAAGGVGCFEFWFNRYQALIAAAVSVAVALYVVRPALRQMRDMSVQTSLAHRGVLAAEATALSTEARAISEMVANIEKIGTSFAERDFAAVDADFESNARFAIKAVADNLDDNRVYYSNKSYDPGDPSPVAVARRQYTASLPQLLDAVAANVYASEGRAERVPDIAQFITKWASPEARIEELKLAINGAKAAATAFRQVLIQAAGDHYAMMREIDDSVRRTLRGS